MKSKEESEKDKNNLSDGIRCQVRSTVSGGFGSKNVDLRDIQLSPELWDHLSLSDGDLIKLVAIHDDNRIESYGRCERRGERFSEPLSSNKVGVGVGLRQGLGVNVGDEVMLTNVEFLQAGYQREILNRIFKIRPGHCRSRKSVFPDVGRKTCRLTKEFAGYLGIDWGDRIVVQSANGRVRGMKALPLSDSQQQRIHDREERNPEKYPPTSALIDSEKLNKDDIPPIYLSGGARSALSLANTEIGTTHQPVKIHRDTRDVFARVVSDLTIPILVGIITIVISFNLATWQLASLLILATASVIYTVWFQTRRVLLE